MPFVMGRWRKFVSTVFVLCPAVQQRAMFACSFVICGLILFLGWQVAQVRGALTAKAEEESRAGTPLAETTPLHVRSHAVFAPRFVMLVPL